MATKSTYESSPPPASAFETQLLHASKHSNDLFGPHTGDDDAVGTGPKSIPRDYR
jgi:hypothetical protein